MRGIDVNPRCLEVTRGFGLGLSIVGSVALAKRRGRAIEVENGEIHVRMRLPRDGR